MSEDESIPLASPGYPIGYPVNTVCSWVILAEGTGRSTLTVVDFDIAHGFDFVNIKNGINTIMSLTGVNAPESVSVNASSMVVHFDSYHWGWEYRGFLFEIIWSPQNSKCS